MQTTEPFAFIQHRSPFVARFIDRVKLVACDRVNGINIKEPRAEAFTVGAVACRIHRVGDLLGGLVLHPKLADHVQAGVFVWVKLRG